MIDNDLNEWIPATEFSKQYPQFTYAQMKHLIANASKNDSIHKCTRIVGRKRYINVRLFTMWVNDELE